MVADLDGVSVKVVGHFLESGLIFGKQCYIISEIQISQGIMVCPKYACANIGHSLPYKEMKDKQEEEWRQNAALTPMLSLKNAVSVLMQQEELRYKFLKIGSPIVIHDVDETDGALVAVFDCTAL